MMYGADAEIENKYKQTPVYLTVNEQCIAQFERLTAEGHLCRADLKDRLEDDRAEALRLTEERGAAEEQRYVSFFATSVSVYVNGGSQGSNQSTARG
jgi:hypothetical protein